MLTKQAPVLIWPSAASGKSLTRRIGIGTAMALQQNVTTTCRRLSATDPALALVLQGRKIVRLGKHEIIAGEGCAVAFPAGFEGDIINEVAGGAYRAVSFYFAPELLTNHQSKGASPVTQTTSLGQVEASFQSAVLATIGAMADEALPAAIAEHRAAELLVWLAARGLRYATPKRRDLTAQVCDLFAAEPARDWTAKDIAERVGMSEPTLRRKLAKQGKSLTDLLLETRMTTALVMLQAGDLPVTQVSYAVGYDSPSRFAMRFRQRFGFSPSDLRKAG